MGTENRMKVRYKSPISTSTIVGLSLLSIGVAQIIALWALTRAIYLSLRESSSVVEVRLAQYSPQLYGLEVVDNRLRLVSRIIETNANSPEVALKDALIQLFSQSDNSEFITTIPQQTRLLNLRITDREIHIDLSKEFSQDGDSSSMIYRVAQVLYTATSIDPQAPVFLSIEGQALDENYTLAGERLLLNYALTRQKLSQDFRLE